MLYLHKKLKYKNKRYNFKLTERSPLVVSFCLLMICRPLRSLVTNASEKMLLWKIKFILFLGRIHSSHLSPQRNQERKDRKQLGLDKNLLDGQARFSLRILKGLLKENNIRLIIEED